MQNSDDLNALMVKVAELCGWEQVVPASLDCVEGLPPLGHEYGRESGHRQVPDYPHDLNACAEFEKMIEQKGLCVEYVNELRDHSIAGRLSRYGLVAATAEQRCRAFVAVMSPPSPAESENKV